jgi:DNA helicase II / ATP-dependent DNA helicase PcrA
MKAFDPQTLRYDRKMKTVTGAPINYGASKGLTFERTLIFPNGPLSKFLLTGDPKDAGSIAKLYVAITRARQSAAIVIKNDSKSPLIPIFEF